ncbi:MAG: zinc-ribbon domain-containing protein, partial [Rubrobacteraceae bacterium]
CPGCGNQIPKESMYCPDCGTTVSDLPAWARWK